MKIAVLIKRVPDTASVFKIGGDNKSVETGNLKFVMSPYDEHAVEEAISIRDAGKAEEVIIVSMGGDGTQETIRTALAMGADRAIFVNDPAAEGLGCKGTSVVLAAVLKSEGVELVFAGKQAVDDDASQVPERVAEILGISHASIVNKFELNDSTAAVEREIEGGHYALDVPLPALFSVEKGLNTPRYPTLPNIMKAKKKEIKEQTLADLGIDPASVASGVTIEEFALPRQERLNKVLEGDNDECVKQLVTILRQEEKVL